VVIFFDDDIILEPHALSNMVKFWRAAPEDVGGAAFNLMNEKYKRPAIMEKIFMVNSDTPLSILKSGFQGKASCLANTGQVSWLIGCAMSWRKDVFKDFIFDERFSGYARYEEVDFSYRVGKKYKLFVVADAGIRHYVKPENVDTSFSLGKMELLNRLYLVHKNVDLSVGLCCWSLFGIFLNNIIKGIVFFDKRSFRRAMGNTAGLAQAIFRK
jgi:GT2 family glycosyltransferase